MGGCQSRAAMTGNPSLWNRLMYRLISGRIVSPSVTGSAPPGQKSFLQMYQNQCRLFVRMEIDSGGGGRGGGLFDKLHGSGDNFSADSLIGKYLQKNGVRNSSINNMGLMHASLKGGEAGKHFGKHPFTNRFFLYHTLHIFS